MHDEAVGAALRAVRQRRGLRQADVAQRAHVSQTVISSVERGDIDGCTLRTVRAVAAALGVDVRLAPRWRHGDLGRLIDRAHAALVERVVRELGANGWEVLVEYTFNHYGDRGSVDVVAWHRARRALLVVEVKSRFVDLQDLLSRLAVKERVVPRLLTRDRGWTPEVVGMVVVAPATHGVRTVLRQHEATFSAALPARTREVRRWCRAPAGPLAGVWLLPDIAGAVGTRVRGRVRRSWATRASGPRGAASVARPANRPSVGVAPAAKGRLPA